MADSPARTPPSARRPRSGSRSRGSRGSRPSSARSARSGASGKSDGDGLDDNVLAMLNIERTSSRNASRERDAKNPRRADAAAAGGEDRGRRPIAPSFDSTGSGGLDYENLVDDEATLDSKGGGRRESLKNALRRTSASGRGGRASAGVAGGDDASAAEVTQEGSTESQWLRDEAARRALEEERRRAFTPRGNYDAAGAQDLDESTNQHDRHGGRGRALDPRTDGTLAGLDDLGDFAGEGGAPRGGGPRPRSRSPGIATSESDGEVSLLSRGDSAPMLGLAALVLLKAKAKKMANRARKRVKAKKKVSIQDGTRGRKRKGDRNSSSRDRVAAGIPPPGDRAPSAERADRSESPPEPWGEEHGAAARAKRALAAARKLKGLGDGPKGDASSEDETENDEGSFPLHVLTDDESAASARWRTARAQGPRGIFVKGETALAGADPPKALPDDKRVDRPSAGEALLPAFHGPRVSLPGGNAEDDVVPRPAAPRAKKVAEGLGRGPAKAKTAKGAMASTQPTGRGRPRRRGDEADAPDDGDAAAAPAPALDDASEGVALTLAEPS
ncbi:hypothetical protein SO694_00043048 [Aureococcus anophagefferens]|uniref:Uncharacterized protein n=1 Tax=Aureococcus anophagefferens TaxID=44056 RepID=A0ABR1G772_AURAN